MVSLVLFHGSGSLLDVWPVLFFSFASFVLGLDMMLPWTLTVPWPVSDVLLLCICTVSCVQMFPLKSESHHMTSVYDNDPRLVGRKVSNNNFQ